MMDHVIIQNIVLLAMLGIVVAGLSALKRRLLQFAQELSRKAPPVRCAVTNLAENKMVFLKNL